MAKIKRNIITQGLNGSIGNQLTFVSQHGETIVKAKHQGTDIPPTQAQTDHRQAFSIAIQIAVMNNLTGQNKQIFIRDFIQSTWPSANYDVSAYV